MSETLKGSGSFTVDIAHRKKLLAAERKKLRDNARARLMHIWSGSDAGDHVLPLIVGAVVTVSMYAAYSYAFPWILREWVAVLRGAGFAIVAYVIGKAMYHFEDFVHLYREYRQRLKNIYLE